MADRSPQLSLAEQIDACCDRYEEAFRAGHNPRMEAFVAGGDQMLRPDLFRALLELDLELRRGAGETPLVSDYDGRFPEERSTIRAVFEESGRAGSLASSVRSTGVDTSQGPQVKAASAKATAAVLPAQFGRFEIRSVLGEGAFGTVYRARDPQLDRDVALKVPRFAGQQSREERERFLREARAAAGLHHAHICPVHEVGTIDGRDYIVLAFIDGKPLSKLLQTHPKLSDRQIASVMRRLALALQEAHDRGIIHRDLKPANIMINRRGEPVIMDFGLARRDNAGDAQISQSGQIMGTPAYMSPEQARGDGKAVGPASDLYSLGVIFYELLCGRRPFEGTVTEVIGQILHVPPPQPSQFRPDVDPRLQAICMRAIAKQPADRYASMQEFAAALVDYAKSRPGETRPTAPSVESAKDVGTDHFAGLLAAISSDMESKVERAVTRAGRVHRIPWLTCLIGAAVMGLVLLWGIFFFIRKDTVTVIVHIPIENIDDPSLSFVLDGSPIAATAFAAPIELKPGEHELVVHQDGREFRRFRFKVGLADNAPVIVQDVTPKSADPPPAASIVWKPLIRSADELIDGDTRSPNVGTRSVRYENGNLVLQGAGAKFIPKFSGRNYVVRAQVLALTDSLVLQVRCGASGSSGYHGVFHDVDRGRDWPACGIGEGDEAHWWGGLAGSWQRVAESYPAEFAISVFEEQITLYVNGERVCTAGTKHVTSGGIRIGSQTGCTATLRDVAVCELDGTELTPDDIYPQKVSPATEKLLSPDFLTDELKQNNLLKNPGFEEGRSQWRSHSGGGERTTIVDSPVHRGQHALRISMDWWNAARMIQTVPVRPHRRYLFSGWIRTDNVRFHERDRSGAHLYVPGGYRHRSASVPITADWTYYAVIFDSGVRSEVEVQPAFGHFGGTVIGSAWFDDLCLVEIPNDITEP